MQIIQDSLDLYYDIQNSKPNIQVFEYATIVFHKISYSITKSIWKTYLKTLINMDWFVNQTNALLQSMVKIFCDEIIQHIDGSLLQSPNPS